MARHSAALLLLCCAASALAQDDTALVEGAFRDAQMAAGTRTALALSRSASRLAAGDPVLAELLRSRETAQAALRGTEAAEVTARSSGAAARDIAAATQRTIAARAALDAADARLAAVSPGYVHLAGIAPVPVAAAQALLSPDEAILLIQPTTRGTYVFVVTDRRIVWRRAALDAAGLADKVQALRVALDPAGATRAGEDAAPDVRAPVRTAFPRACAYELYRSLLAPVEAMTAGRRTLYVVAGGALGALPLGVLVTAPPRGDDRDPAALRKTAWLIRRHALVALPSVGSLRALRAGGPHAAVSRAFAGFGDPLLDGAVSADTPRSFAQSTGLDAGETAARVKALPRLPGSAQELRAIARALGAGESSLALGAAATEASVRAADLSATGVVAFATHGLLAGEIGPLTQPALVLTPPTQPRGDDDGLLTADEAATLRLSADWVVLSACNTAATDGAADGEGLSGLARGFFSAGARAVLASHWRVRDDTAAALTAGTLARYAAHPQKGRARALQRAMVAMVDDRRHPERASPAYWAPFVIAGEGR